MTTRTRRLADRGSRTSPATFVGFDLLEHVRSLVERALDGAGRGRGSGVARGRAVDAAWWTKWCSRPSEGVEDAVGHALVVPPAAYASGAGGSGTDEYADTDLDFMV
jgi:hypothetical protein